MRVWELNEEQKIKAKQMYLTEIRDKEGASPSMAELAYVDDIISDEDLRLHYLTINFVEDDFA